MYEFGSVIEVEGGQVRNPVRVLVPPEPRPDELAIMIVLLFDLLSAFQELGQGRHRCGWLLLHDPMAGVLDHDDAHVGCD
jgi:hypothetical protein